MDRVTSSKHVVQNRNHKAFDHLFMQKKIRRLHLWRFLSLFLCAPVAGKKPCYLARMSSLYMLKC